MAIKKLILDLDMGVDDAMALAYAIASPEVELVGITTCFGNVRVDQSAHNCLAVLDLLGRPEVPVYLGADRPLQATEPYTPPASTALIHGKNGIGGASVPASPYEPVGATSADGNAAVDYLIDAARTYGPDLRSDRPALQLGACPGARCGGGDVYRPRGGNGRRPDRAR